MADIKLNYSKPKLHVLRAGEKKLACASGSNASTETNTGCHNGSQQQQNRCDPYGGVAGWDGTSATNECGNGGVAYNPSPNASCNAGNLVGVGATAKTMCAAGNDGGHNHIGFACNNGDTL